jgi:hypothetical protein
MTFNRSAIVLTFLAATIALPGCASYRTSANISTDKPIEASAALPTTANVLISEDSLPGRKYKEIAPLEVSVKKLTVFHKDPTKEQADDALREAARGIGANAVINVKYKSGVGLTTWGYMDAGGTGVKLDD